MSWEKWNEEHKGMGGVARPREQALEDSTPKKAVKKTVGSWSEVVRQEKHNQALRHLGPEANDVQADALKRDLDHKAGQLIGSSHQFFRAGSEGLVKALEGGRFKNTFETGNFAEGFDKGQRLSTENKLFTIPKEAPASARPFYGYMSSDVHGGVGDPDREEASYGALAVKLKPAVRERSTVTFGDSFGHRSGYFDASPVNSPRHTSMGDLDAGADTGGGADKILGASKVEDLPYVYVEHQIHGGVTPDDVESVHAHNSWARENPEQFGKVKSALAAKGIPLLIM